MMPRCAKVMCILLGLGAWLPCGMLRAQLDPDPRLFLQGGVEFDPGSDADVTATGFLYWNRPDAPGVDTNLIWAGPYLDATVLLRDFPREKTAVGLRTGGLGWFAAPSPEFIQGDPLKEQTYSGSNVRAGLVLHHEIATFTRFKIPLNFKLAADRVETDYSRNRDTDRTFQLPEDGGHWQMEAKLQLGGTPPGLRGVEALDVHLRWIMAHRDRWDSYGPEDAPFEAFSTSHQWIAAAGISAPFFSNHTTGLRVTAGAGQDLDRSSSYRLGGFLRRNEESIRIAGTISEEFSADSFVLINIDHEIPLADWRSLTLHLMADLAWMIQEDERGTVHRRVTGLGAGVSLEAWGGTDVQLLYGFAPEAERKSTSAGHSIALRVHRTF